MHNAESLKKTYESLDEGTKKKMSKLVELIEQTAMTPEQIKLLMGYGAKAADTTYPELEQIEGMSSEEYAKFYADMANEIKASPEKYEQHAKDSGMSTADLEVFFSQIKGAIDEYPEIWKSQETAQMLSPKNLAILVNVFRK